MNPVTQSKNTTILPVVIALTLVCFAFSPTARATCQDACLTNNSTAQGDNALVSNTGFYNTAFGFSALFSNTSGGFNTAVGWEALDNNTAGDDNTAVGLEALQSNTTGSFNTAVDLQSLNSNRSDGNTAVGWVALQQNTTGGSNTAPRTCARTLC